MNPARSLLTGLICLLFGLFGGTTVTAHTLSDDSVSEVRVQLVNAKAELNARMLKKTEGPVLISTTSRQELICGTCYYSGALRSDIPKHSCDRKCDDTYYREEIIVKKGPLIVDGEVDLVLRTIKYSVPEVYGVPTQVTSQTLEHINCDPPGKSSISETVGFATTLTTSTTFSKSVTESKSLMLNLQAQFGLPGGAQLGASAGGSITTSVNITNGNIQSKTENFSRNVHVSATAHPHTKIAVHTVGQVWKGHVHFEALVAADANIVNNEVGKTRVADVLSVEDRTFPVVGILTSDVITNVQSKKVTLPYDCNEED